MKASATRLHSPTRSTYLRNMERDQSITVGNELFATGVSSYTHHHGSDPMMRPRAPQQTWTVDTRNLTTHAATYGWPNKR